MSGRSTAVLLLLHLTPGSLLQFQHLVVVRVVETLLPRHLKPEVIDCSQPVYCTALALVQHDLADSVDGDIRPLSPLKVPVVTVVLDNPFKVTNQTFEQICDIIGVLPVKVWQSLNFCLIIAQPTLCACSLWTLLTPSCTAAVQPGIAESRALPTTSRYSGKSALARRGAEEETAPATKCGYFCLYQAAREPG